MSAYVVLHAIHPVSKELAVRFYAATDSGYLGGDVLRFMPDERVEFNAACTAHAIPDDVRDRLTLAAG